MKSKLNVDKIIYDDACKAYHAQLESAKLDYHRSQLHGCDTANLFKVVNTICNPATERLLPAHTCSRTLSTQFSDFFSEKIETIRNDLDLIPNIHKPNDIALTVTNSFVEFKEISTSAVRKIINRAPAKTCNLDPIPTPLLITCLDVLLPTITNIVNLSLSTGIMPASLKTGLVVPILKKNNIDKEILKNYRPISLPSLPF